MAKRKKSQNENFFVRFWNGDLSLPMSYWGVGVGIGIIFGNYLSGAMRNPSAAQKQFPNLLLGFALAEATGLFGLVVALIILFAF